ncbi:MAG: PGF-pre-PGF domain-containing protein [Clostridia bacterium]|nr:PGF-pre-PGF domain-containing protein [Clostridia bacterium]
MNKIQYFLAILLFLCVASPLLIDSASAAAIVSISPSTQSVEEGQDFTISVYVNPDVPISGAQFNLLFDSSLVSVNSISEGNLFNQAGDPTLFNTAASIDNSQGIVSNVFGLIIGKNNITTPGVFSTIDLTAANISGICTFELSDVVISNSAGDSLPVSIENGNAAIGDVTTSPDVNTGSSGGGGGGGNTGEDFDNIEFKEVTNLFVNRDANISFSFVVTGNPITYVDYGSLANAGSISTTIEVLKSTSALVATPPSGTVYKNVNIWVGLYGYATEKNIKDPVVGFKVSRTWLSDNNVKKSTILLSRYSSGAWDPLPTIRTTEDAEYVYYEAQTPGFSPFAIVSQVPSNQISMGSISGSSGSETSEEEASVEDVPTESQTTIVEPTEGKSEKTPFIGGGISLCLVVAAGLICRKRK